MNKVVWSLFDGSGLALQKYAEAGWKCFAFNADAGNHGEYVVKVNHPNINYVDVWIDSTFHQFTQDMDIPSPDLVFGFPDCTLFAGSGSQHDRSDDDIQIALAGAKLVESIGDEYNCPWFVENPVGKLSTLWRKPNDYFDPWQYGGWLNESEGSFHKKMPLCDGYTKKTCIWHGNGFVFPEYKPGHINIGFFWGWKYLGGKSSKTKQLRSLTPRGFARAVFNANQ